MNHTKMSDFEINKAVGEIILEGKWACKPGCAGNQSDSWHYGSVDTFVTPYPALPDYCNSWADAGPIIENENISLTCHQSRDEWAAIFNRHAMAAHSNPLRAAMECYLMKKGRENAA
ncbi:DUF2591 domain-containing protein [Pantoea dispersa]|nr:DUF2591 domain-containing protein [Pantoea dispersa]